MSTKAALVAAIGSMIFALGSLTLAAEKLKYAATVRTAPSYMVPLIAAEEKGFWKQQGVDVEVVGFRGGVEVGRAVAAKQVDVGTMETISAVLSAARGIPLILVGSFNEQSTFYIWVLPDSPLKNPKDLHGARVAVTSLHDLTGSYGQMLRKALGIDLKLVAAGGSVERLALLRARRVDANLAAPSGVAPLVVKGELRQILLIEDYTPKPWNEYHIFSRKDVAQNNPEAVKKVVRAILKAGDFIRENSRWAIEAMKTHFGYSEEAAKFVYDISFTEIGGQGRIDPRGIDNVTNFLVEYGLVAKDKAPAVSDMYSSKFTD